MTKVINEKNILKNDNNVRMMVIVQLMSIKLVQFSCAQITAILTTRQSILNMTFSYTDLYYTHADTHSAAAQTLPSSPQWTTILVQGPNLAQKSI